jgi:hypothetical protein
MVIRTGGRANHDGWTGVSVIAAEGSTRLSSGTIWMVAMMKQHITR